MLRERAGPRWIGLDIPFWLEKLLNAVMLLARLEPTVLEAAGHPPTPGDTVPVLSKLCPRRGGWPEEYIGL